MNNCMIYDVKPVGDANCIVLHSFQHNEEKCVKNSLMIDFGSPTGTKLAPNSNAYNILKAELENKACDVNEFLLSHYHADHYNGLFDIPDGTMNISMLYYPYIPEIINPTSGVNSVAISPTSTLNPRKLIICLTTFVAAIKTKATITNMGLGLINLLNKKNKNNSYRKKAVHIGDVIFTDCEVVWPPDVMIDKSAQGLLNCIKKIEKEIKKDKLFSKIWDTINRMKFNNDTYSIDFKENELDYEHIEKYVKEIEENDTREKIIENIEKFLSKYTNRFSVCLYRANDFLFLGDLEKKEVELCLKNLKKKIGGKIKVNYFVTPHHGTIAHYFPLIGNYVDAEYIISSNGKKHYLNYATAYDSMGTYAHLTYKNGEFIGITKC